MRWQILDLTQFLRLRQTAFSFLSARSGVQPRIFRFPSYSGIPALGIGDSSAVNFALYIPPTVTSNYYYVYIKSDAKNKVFELLGEANNIQRSDSIFVLEPLPVDLRIDTVYTDVDTFNSGSNMALSWITRNQEAGIAAAPGWLDAVYLSVDDQFDPGLDLRIGEFEMDQVSLGLNDTTLQQHNALIPNGISGDYYVFVFADDYDANMDADTTNNVQIALSGGAPRQIHILLSPSADLVFDNILAPATTIAGQPLTVQLITGNDGTASAFNWQTRMYLSSDATIGAGDILLTTDINNNELIAGGTVTDTLTAFIPVTAFGNLILIVQLDAANQVYEHNGENNNIQTRSIEIVLPPPSDLIVDAISIPDSVFAGDTATVFWETRNNGVNPSSGNFREIVYFSSDTILDVGDQVFSILDDNIYVPPGGNVARSANASLNGLARADYYALVQTDARNNIYESNDTNNITPSDAQMNIDIEQLFLDSLTSDQIVNLRQHYFRIEIPTALDGESLQITLDGDSLAAYNEIYLKYGDVPTLANFDASHIFPGKVDQELIFEGLQGGTYYVMVRGYKTAATEQNVTILARIIDFELLSVSPGKMLRNSQVTLELIGTQMDTIRNVYIVRDSTIRIKADTFYSVTSRLAYATFSIDSVPFYNLDQVPLGFYDVEAERWDGKLAAKPDAVEVIGEGDAPDLQFIMEYPQSVSRFNRPMKITIYMQNSGDADLVNEHFVFESPYGNEMAFTYEDLLSGNTSTSLEIPVQGPFGPPGILPPKAGTIIEVFAYSRPHPTFALTPVNQ